MSDRGGAWNNREHTRRENQRHDREVSNQHIQQWADFEFEKNLLQDSGMDDDEAFWIAAGDHGIPDGCHTEGCYIATCVYGSYDCPEVWTLRRWRDGALGSCLPGRALIHCYYAVSPALVRRFGQRHWFHRFWRAFLDSLTHQLQAAGYSSAPYRDRNWRKRQRR